MSTVLDQPDRAVVDDALAWPDRARAVVITNDDSYQTACGLLLGIKELRKKVADTFDKHIKAAHEAHKALVKEKADAEAPLTQAEGILKTGLVAYDREQERLRQEEQRRRDDEARRAEEARILEQAAAMELEGQEFGDTAMVDEAHALISHPVQAVAAPVQKATPKVAGVVLKKSFAFRVVNPALVPAQYKVTTINEAAIRAVVRGLGMAANIPGVQVYEETSVAAGRR